MDIQVNILFGNGSPGSEGTSLIGMPITIGKSKKRWLIKDLLGRGDNPLNNPEEINYFLFVGTRQKLAIEGPVKIVTFKIKDFNLRGETVGDEVAIYLDEKREVTVWTPGPQPPPPTITD